MTKALQDESVADRNEQRPALEAPDRLSDGGGLTLTEAAALFTVSCTTLRRLVKDGVIRAYKVEGARGREWRLSASAVEQAGYGLRSSDPAEDEGARPEVTRLAAALAAERARSSRLDGQLGYALLTIGRLRGRLQQAGIDPDELFGAELGRAADDAVLQVT